MSGEEIRLLCQALRFEPKVVCEVGVHGPPECRAAAFADAELLLVEPLAACAEALRNAFPSAAVHQVAIGATSGRAQFADADQCSHLAGQAISPNTEHWHRPARIVDVNVVPFSRVDPGNIDVLFADVEGAEWDILVTLRSRPRIIILEMHSPGGIYQNPNQGLILTWMSAMRYSLQMVDQSDCVWLRDQST